MQLGGSSNSKLPATESDKASLAHEVAAFNPVSKQLFAVATTPQPEESKVVSQATQALLQVPTQADQSAMATPLLTQNPNCHSSLQAKNREMLV